MVENKMNEKVKKKAMDVVELAYYTGILIGFDIGVVLVYYWRLFW